jgi:hypothetical protein
MPNRKSAVPSACARAGSGKAVTDIPIAAIDTHSAEIPRIEMRLIAVRPAEIPTAGPGAHVVIAHVVIFMSSPLGIPPSEPAGVIS